MQTAKIKIGKDYAYQRPSGLVRFRATAIVTTRKGDRPADASNEIHGFIVEDMKNGMLSDTVRVDPANLLGPYEEQVELVERKKAEDAERQRKTDEMKANQIAVRAALYTFVRAPMPKQGGHLEMFELHYAGGVQIHKSGVDALVKRFAEDPTLTIGKLDPLPAGELEKIVRGEKD